MYDHTLDFETNYKQGPFFDGAILERIIPPKSSWPSLFDYQIMSRVGVFACPATASPRSIKLMSDLGYDIITAKTIRSHPFQAHPYPHVTFIKEHAISDFDQTITASSTPGNKIATACSIGNASFTLEQSRRDLAKSLSHLKEGQILISSIYGVGDTQSALIKDFVFLAKAVYEVGVHAIELNLSCPNLDGMIQDDVDAVGAVCAAVVAAIAPTPVIIKLGLFKDDIQMQKVLLAAARAGVQGISCINSIGMKIVDTDGKSYFGTRKKGGVSGEPIRPYALAFAKKVAAVIAQHHLDIMLLAGGGITSPEHIDLFFDCSADAAMMAAGAMYNPYLAHEYQTYRFAHQKNASQVCTPSSF